MGLGFLKSLPDKNPKVEQMIADSTDILKNGYE
jgi:hypothetical protein